jgi:hypothetical protein
MPLKEQNSPRSQWISNVSLLKNQLKDGELVVPKKESGPKLTWNELEAQLGKRMRDTRVTGQSTPHQSDNIHTRRKLEVNPLSPTSAALNLIPHPRLSPTRMTAPLPPGTPTSPVVRPSLNIPTGPKSTEILKQVHNGSVQLPNRTSSTPRTMETPTTKPSKGLRAENAYHTSNVATPTTKQSKGSTAVDTNKTSKVSKAIEIEANVDNSYSVRRKDIPIEAEGKYAASTYDETIYDETTSSLPLTVKVSKDRTTSKQLTEAKVMNVEKRKEIVKEEKAASKPFIDAKEMHVEKLKKIVNDRHRKNDAKNSCKTQPDQASGTKLSVHEKSDAKNAAVNTSKPTISDASSVSTQACTVNSAAPSSRKLPRPVRDSTKTKGSMSWLRRTLKPNSRGSKKTVTSSTLSQVSLISLVSSSTVTKSFGKDNLSSHVQSDSQEEVVEKYFRPTTPLQLGLWLSELQKAIRVAKLKQNKLMPTMAPTTTVPLPVLIVDACPSQQEHQSDNCIEFQQNGGTINTEGEDLYYKKNRDIGVYVDYSTFDDGDSVSSIDLLFKWLTCRDLNDVGNSSQKGYGSITPPGTVIATESNVSDELSIDLDVQPTRRTFFSR